MVYHGKDRTNAWLALRYDVAVSRLAADGSLLQMSRIYYNYLHLSMTEEHYLIDGSGSPVPAYQTVNTFNIPIDQHARATTFNQPIQIDQLHYVPQTGSYQPMRQSTTSYSDYGNPLVLSDMVWDAETNSYKLQKTSTLTYVPVKWSDDTPENLGGELLPKRNGEMLETQIDKDCVTGREKKITYVLTANQRSISSTTTYYREHDTEAWIPWKTKSYAYDAFGRITSETLGWSPSAPYPAGSVASYTHTKSYSFDANSSVLTVTDVDALGACSSQQTIVSVLNGPLIKKTSPLGHVETFQYDLLGRLTELKDALGHITATTYSVGSGSYIQCRTALGYVTRKEYDVLGRETRVLDNGLDGAAVPTRVLVQTAFDAASRIVKTINSVGLVAVRSYDALSRITSSTDTDGNVSTKTYDDARLTTQQRVNGDLRVEEKANGIGQNIETASYGDSVANPGYQLVTRPVYNGMGKVVSSTLVKQAGATQSLLVKQTSTYDIEDNAISLLLVSAASTSTAVDDPNASTDQVKRDIQFDIFGNSVTYTKTASYHDGRSFTHAGPVSQFDAGGRLAKLTNQLGQAEVNEFDADGRLTKMTRYDGSTFTYAYDKLGQQTSSTSPDGSTQSTYLPNGRLATQATSDGQTVRYEYSLDGCATAIHYPGGVSQHFVLDAFSRVAQEIDSAGVTTVFTYDDRGRLTAKASPAANVAYTFGTSNHTFGILCQTSVVTATQTQTREHRYDGFGREEATIDRDAQGRTTLGSIYSRDARGRTLACEVQSTVFSDQSINYTRRFDYDGLGQLTKECQVFAGAAAETMTTEYVYDGNYNIVKKVSNSQTALYSYNAMDQRGDVGFSYDTNGRLISDPDGRTYRYDSRDRLVSVTKEGAVNYTYHPDGSLAQRSSQDTQSAFYHSGSSINCIKDSTTSGETDWTSYLVHQAGRVAASSGSQQPTLFLESQKSTVLSLNTGGDATYYASSAYGQQTSETSARFGWKQELVDKDNGLVYLQSRYYSPQHRTFLTIDSSRSQENRYAFCNGDPVNLSDSTGHDGQADGAIAAAVIGNVVGIAVTLASGFALCQLGAALCTNANMTAVGIAAATISGAGGSLCGDATYAAVAGESLTWGRAGEDLLSGALGGAIGAGSGALASETVMRFLKYTEALVPRTVAGFGAATSLLIGGAAGSFSGAATSAVIHGEPIFSSKTALAALQGAASAGAGGALWASASFLGLGSHDVLPIFMTESELDGLHVAHSQNSKVDQSRVFLMSTALENSDDFRRLANDPKQLFRANDNTEHLTIVAHGSQKHMYATVKYRGGEVYCLIKASTLAKAANRHFTAPRNFQLRNSTDIKLLSCYGAVANGQAMANATGRRVWAAYEAISVTDTPVWHLFKPKL